MRAREFLRESQSQWQLVTSNHDKREIAKQLIDLTAHAYSRTDQGSFVRSMVNVLSSHWFILKKDGKIIAAIFYRGPRANESWRGQKIQGIGHDGSSVGKLAIQAKRLNLLSQSGWWSESSGASRQVLLKGGAPVVKNVNFLRQLFRDPELRMIDDHTYIRRIPSGEITETVFGHPSLK